MDRAETASYDGEAALEDVRELLGAEEERRVRQRRGFEITQFSSWGDGPFARSRQVESAAAQPVNDGVRVRLRGAGVASTKTSWGGYPSLSALLTPLDPAPNRSLSAVPTSPESESIPSLPGGDGHA